MGIEEFRLVDPPKPYMVCSICTDVCWKPVFFVRVCQCTHCSKCMQKWLRRGVKTCPMCIKDLSGVTPLPNQLMKQLVEELYVRCVSCSWRGRAEQMAKHDEICGLEQEGEEESEEDERGIADTPVDFPDASCSNSNSNSNTAAGFQAASCSNSNTATATLPVGFQAAPRAVPPVPLSAPPQRPSSSAPPTKAPPTKKSLGPSVEAGMPRSSPSKCAEDFDSSGKAQMLVLQEQAEAMAQVKKPSWATEVKLPRVSTSASQATKHIQPNSEASSSMMWSQALSDDGEEVEEVPLEWGTIESAQCVLECLVGTWKDDQSSSHELAIETPQKVVSVTTTRPNGSKASFKIRVKETGRGKYQVIWGTSFHLEEPPSWRYTTVSYALRAAVWIGRDSFRWTRVGKAVEIAVPHKVMKNTVVIKAKAVAKKQAIPGYTAAVNWSPRSSTKRQKEKKEDGSEIVAEEAMPSGWESTFSDKDKRTYYFNRMTQESSWERPKATSTVETSKITAADSEEVVRSEVRSEIQHEVCGRLQERCPVCSMQIDCITMDEHLDKCLGIMRTETGGSSSTSRIDSMLLQSQFELESQSIDAEGFSVQRRGRNRGKVSLPASESKSAGGAKMPANLKLRAGGHVKIHSLQKAKELNDMHGICQHWVQENSRWLVQLQTGDFKYVKSDNLQALANSGPAVTIPLAVLRAADEEEQDGRQEIPEHKESAKRAERKEIPELKESGKRAKAEAKAQPKPKPKANGGVKVPWAPAQEKVQEEPDPVVALVTGALQLVLHSPVFVFHAICYVMWIFWSSVKFLNEAFNSRGFNWEKCRRRLRQNIDSDSSEVFKRNAAKREWKREQREEHRVEMLKRELEKEGSQEFATEFDVALKGLKQKAARRTLEGDWIDAMFTQVESEFAEPSNPRSSRKSSKQKKRSKF